jgi:hypothetical protein
MFAKLTIVQSTIFERKKVLQIDFQAIKSVVLWLKTIMIGARDDRQAKRQTHKQKNKNPLTGCF